VIWARARRHFGFGRPSPPSSQLGASATTAATPTVAAMMHARACQCLGSGRSSPSFSSSSWPAGMRFLGAKAASASMVRDGGGKGPITAGRGGRMGWDHEKGVLGVLDSDSGDPRVSVSRNFHPNQYSGRIQVSTSGFSFRYQTPYRIRTHHFAI